MVLRRAFRARDRSRQLMDAATALCLMSGFACRDAHDLRHDARDQRIRHSAVRLAKAS
jgi:hypothetical protein